VLRGDVVDELLDDHGLADSGAAEQADLAALHVWSEQVDDLDARLEDLVRRVEGLEVRGGAMDRPTLGAFDLAEVVDGLPHHVHEPTERLLAHRDGDRPTGVGDHGAARQAVGRIHGDGADLVVAEMLLHLADKLVGLAVAFDYDGQGVVDRRQRVGEPRIDDGPDDLDHCAFVHGFNSARAWLIPRPRRPLRLRGSPA